MLRNRSFSRLFREFPVSDDHAAMEDAFALARVSALARVVQRSAAAAFFAVCLYSADGPQRTHRERSYRLVE
jgi:hypothetical protein